MRTTAADELLKAIAELRGLFPNWRLGQLFANLASAAGLLNPESIGDIEDVELLEAARRLIERNSDRANGASMDG